MEYQGTSGIILDELALDNAINKFVSECAYKSTQITVQEAAILLAIKNGAEGIGLYRTEFMYLKTKIFPTEEELFETYKHVLNTFLDLSKIPRIVDMFSKRLQVQERLTHEIAETIDQVLQPRGVAVVMTGEHSCASLRGVKKHGINMKTMEFIGEFRTDKDLKNEYYQLINIR